MKQLSNSVTSSAQERTVQSLRVHPPSPLQESKVSTELQTSSIQTSAAESSSNPELHFGKKSPLTTSSHLDSQHYDSLQFESSNWQKLSSISI